MIATAIRKVNTRSKSTTLANKSIPLEAGGRITIKRFEFGEMYRGSNLWIVDEAGKRYWGGAFDLPTEETNLVSSPLFNELSILQMWKYSTGQNVKIGIIDCGLNPNHPCLKQSTVTVLRQGDPNCSHGTYMSSICAGTDSVNGMLGIAPSSEILFCGFGEVKALEPAELEQCLLALKDADIISMSFSLFDVDFTEETATGKQLSDLLKTFSESKILLAAAGNQEPIEREFYPAAYDSIISVSAYKKENNGIVHGFANFWDGITAVGPFEGYYDAASIPPNSFPGAGLRGTSSTTAVMAGLIALVVAKLKRQQKTISQPAIKEMCFSPTQVFSELAGKTFNTLRLDIPKILQTLKADV